MGDQRDFFDWFYSALFNALARWFDRLGCYVVQALLRRIPVRELIVSSRREWSLNAGFYLRLKKCFWLRRLHRRN